MFGDDREREAFFWGAAESAKREHEEDPTNAQALVRWGSALLELAHFKSGTDSVDSIVEAIGHLQKAAALDPTKADAEWCLGNAYTSLGFLQNEKPQAQLQFNKAAECFRKCMVKDPSNDSYRKALEMCDKAPEYYDEIQSHIQAQAAAEGASHGGKPAPAASPEDFWWDVGGWVLLFTAIGVSALFLAKSAKPATA